jgi:hypothetical protein
MSTVGGHKREELEWALDVWDEPYVARSMIAAPLEDCGPSYTDADRAALKACGDPSQLATLLKASTPLLVDATAEDGSIVLCYFVDTDVAHRTVDMPEARRVLLGLLTSEEHLKILRGEV